MRAGREWRAWGESANTRLRRRPPAICRFAAYLGEPLLVEDILYRPDGGLVHQAVEPTLMSKLNLGGFGLAAWDGGDPAPGPPLTYRVPTIPSFDRNLRALAAKIRTTAMVAHVRGVVFDSGQNVGVQNVHPFMFAGSSIALAQNGDLYDFARIRYDLLEYLDGRLLGLIEGTTDTEWVYALVLSQLDDPFGPVSVGEAEGAVQRALEILRELRARRDITTQSPVNLLLTNGEWMLATRYTYDYGWYPEDDSFFAGEREHDFTSLWYTAGGRFSELADGSFGVLEGATTSAVVASEPLTRHVAGWLEVPEYSMLVLATDEGRLTVSTKELE
jgi:predicted glutamine amidotransferase